MNQLLLSDFLYETKKKYKLLQAIPQSHLRSFQNQIITLLIDEKNPGTIDPNIYQQIKKNIGIPKLIIQLLGNTFSNNKIQISNPKEKNQIAKKHAALTRKQNDLKKYEDDLISKVRTKIISLEKEFTLSMEQHQNQMKKRINTLISQLRNKQKMIIQKNQESKKLLKKIQEIGNKQQRVNERIRYLQKLQKNQITLPKNSSSQNTLRQGLQKLQNENKSLQQKLKNLDMAYKRIKKQLLSKDQIINQKNVQIKKLVEQKMSQKQNATPKNSKKQVPISQNVKSLESNLLQLQISKIHDNNEAQFFMELNKVLDSQQESQTMQPQQQVPSPQKQQLSQKYQKELRIQKCSSNKDFISLLKQIVQELEQQPALKLKFINSNQYGLLLEKINQFHYPKKVCMEFLDLMLILIQVSADYEHIMESVSSKQTICLLEKIYMANQSSQEISEMITLSLSRVKLHLQKKSQWEASVLGQDFMNCLKIKYSASKHNRDLQMLQANIKSILD